MLIEQGQPADAPVITEMVGGLLHETMAAIGDPVVRFDPNATRMQTQEWLRAGKTMAWLARDEERRAVVGFGALC